MFSFQPEMDSVDFFRELNSTTAAPTACVVTDDDGKTLAYTVAINILIFITVCGVSSVVEFSEFKKSFKSKPIYTGAAFQFFLMPFIGFITVLIFPLDNLNAVTLLILTASPGGSYSNWWCNLFNADLALSVSMTSLSTVASIGMLPLNIALYITLAYERTIGFEGEDIEIDYKDLGLTLGVVITAIISGLYLGTKFPKQQSKFNFVGNISGLTSIILGVFASADTCDGEAPWNQAFFPLWVATAFPLLFALGGTLILGKFLGLKKPQRVAISLETAYQNTSISLAYALSQGEPGRRAAGIPVIYGGYEAGFFFIFMFASWKLGWTYAPPNTKFYRVLFETWQPGSPNHRATYPEYYLTEEKKEVVTEEKTSEEKSNNIVVEIAGENSNDKAAEKADEKAAERASATIVKEQKGVQLDGVSL